MTTSRDVFNTIEIDKTTTNGIIYVTQEDDRGFWIVKKIDISGGPITISYANITNNTTIQTAAAAIAAKEDLNYASWAAIF